MIKNILLDCDGVLADFLGSALDKLNARYNRNITPEEYAKSGIFDMEKVFDISVKDFWDTIETDDFWINLEPIPWGKKVFTELNKIAPVTISTSPSKNPICAAQKTAWVKKHLNLDNSYLMLGSRKYLMANPQSVLIDDYTKNTTKFINHGGHAILIPSSWNTPNLSYEIVWDVIQNGLQYIDPKRQASILPLTDTKGKEF